MRKANIDFTRRLIQGILKAQKVGKMQSIYEGIAPADDGAVHSFQNPAGTTSTRFSHSGTWLFSPGSYNLATLPKKTAIGEPLYNVRDVIVPHEGRVFGAADYSQAEARWAAFIANDPVRLRIYEDGIDHYRWFVALLKWDDASRADEVSKRERNAIGKVGVLSGQYQVGWRTMMDAVNADVELHGVTCDAKTAKKMEALWPEMMPRTTEWWKEVEDMVLTKGYTVNPFGRKRRYFGRTARPSDRRRVVRQAIADECQSANAMMLNTAIRRLYESYDPELIRLLQNVHDEILWDCAPEDKDEAVRVIKDVMETPFVNDDGRRLVIPAEVATTTTAWSQMEEVKP